MAVKNYHKLDPKQILSDIVDSQERDMVDIKGIKMYVFPHVYPSDKFRTTNFALDSIYPLLQGKKVCDMGCGMGTVGLFALHNGAREVVQADINPIAVENAVANKKLHNFTDEQMRVYLSDCFDNIPKQHFDLIVWNMPFHTEPHEIIDPLEYAFHDPLFRGLKKFLKQLPEYSNENTITTIAFSNKGDIKQIESIFNSFGLKWELWKIINTDKEYDNRMYLIRQK